MSLSDKPNMDRQEQIKKFKKETEKRIVYIRWRILNIGLQFLFLCSASLSGKKSSIGRKVVRGKEEDVAADDGTLATFLLYNASTLL